MRSKIEMRLDKYLVSTGVCSRSEASAAVRKGNVTVNGVVAKSASAQINENEDTVVFCGRQLVYRKFTYIMLNKPTGVVSATEDGDKTVIDLLPDELRRIGLFPCGRLDKNTTGLMLLTNDGALSHRLLAPKSHVDKTYRYSCKFPLSKDDILSLERGVDIGGYVTAPCRIESIDEKNGNITICEGKYHQIKLMMQAVHNQITSLERISFANLVKDPSLRLGEWRYLSSEEISGLKNE